MAKLPRKFLAKDINKIKVNRYRMRMQLDCTYEHLPQKIGQGFSIIIFRNTVADVIIRIILYGLIIRLQLYSHVLEK